MPKVMCLYLDDSGTRNPDRKLPEKFMFRDWFALGGFITKEEDEGAIETAHAIFCAKWKITYPLHSYDIRSETEDFTWLAALAEREHTKFMRDLSGMLLGVPVIGHACGLIARVTTLATVKSTEDKHGCCVGLPLPWLSNARPSMH
jgi:hypothetical protein